MPQYTITFTHTTGEVHIGYDDAGTLRLFNAKEAVLTATQIEWLYKQIPMQLTDVKAQLGALIIATKNKIAITQSSFDVDFETFWKAYNRKFNKKRAQALYAKLTYAKKVKCIERIPVYDKFLRSQRFDRAKLDADSYIRNEAWENDWENG
jgi:uncharacterized protein YkwD